MIKFSAVLILTVCGLTLSAQSFNELSTQIESHLANKDWEQAGEKIERCLENFELDPLAQANLNHNLGLCKLQMEDYLGAKRYLGIALDLKEAHYPQKNADYGKTLQLLGDLSLQIGDYDRARNYLKEAQSSIKSDLGELSDENVEALINLGQFYEALGDYKTAHYHFNQALSISKEIHHEESGEFAKVLNHIGRIYIQNGELELAEESLVKANGIYHELGDSYAIEYVESLENLAMLYEHRGEFSQAERLLLSIEREKRKIPDLPEELLLETLNDLGILYMDLNNLERAAGYFSEVKRLSEKHLGEEHNFYATAINNLAAIAKQEGMHEEAKKLLLDAIEIFKRVYGTNHPQYANALNNLASVERQLGNFKESEEYYKSVLEIDKVIYGEMHPNYATTVNNLGILYSSMGDYTAAGSYYQQALEIRKNTLGVNHPSYARSVENLGLHYFSLKDYTQSEKYLKEAIDIQIDQISTIFPGLTENERVLFYKNIREDIERYTYVAYQLLDERPDLIQNILNHQIATKGTLFSSSERIRRAVFNSYDNNLIKQYTEWSEAKVRLAGYYQLGEAKLKRFGINLREVERSIENMEKDMMLRSDVFKGLFNLEQKGWKDVRRELDEKQALVEVVRFREFNNQVSESTGYFGFTDKVHYIFIVLKHDSFLNPEYVVLENGAALESKGFSLYSNSVKYESDLRTSYINYWASVDKKLNDVDKVVVCPDGVFFKMNPNVLKSGKNEYVIDRYFVTYVTNSKDILKGANGKVDQLSATLVGNPDYGSNNGDFNFKLDNLPGAQKEVEELADMMKKKGWDIRMFTQKEASETRLKSTYQPTVLHIATHGYFADNDPVISRITPGNNPMFKSGLYLRGAIESYGNYLNGKVQDSKNDGILSSFEAMNLNLNNTRLVVLSACETAMGDIELGEGVYGLQRAIMVAGAENLITSMTKVEDEATQVLMTYFYKEFLESDQVIDSFRNAQFKLRKTYPDPRVWGAFLVTGNG